MAYCRKPLTAYVLLPYVFVYAMGFKDSKKGFYTLGTPVTAKVGEEACRLIAVHENSIETK